MTDQKVVIVGAGLSGFRTAEALRRAGHRGDLLLIGSEQHAPYDRPPLSKEVLRGERSAGDIALCDDAFFAEQDVQLRLGTTVSSVDTTNQEVVLDDGDVVGYDQLVIATGLTPRLLACADLPRLHPLRSLDDCLNLRRDLRSADRALVVGVGSTPAVGWLKGSGLAVADGVLCDQQGRASVPGVWAVGDVAAWLDPVTGRCRRVEHWTRAGEQARTVAHAILGVDDGNAGAPYIWSDQYGMKLQIVGEPDGRDDVTVQTDDGRRFLATYARDGLLTAIVGAGQAKRVARLRGLLSQPVGELNEVMA